MVPKHIITKEEEGNEQNMNTSNNLQTYNYTPSNADPIDPNEIEYTIIDDDLAIQTTTNHRISDNTRSKSILNNTKQINNIVTNNDNNTTIYDDISEIIANNQSLRNLIAKLNNALPEKFNLSKKHMENLRILIQTYPIPPEVLEAIPKTSPPVNHKEATKGSDNVLWKYSQAVELLALYDNKTFKIAKKTEVKTYMSKLSSKWVFSYKENHLGKVVRYKSRLVARGFLQRKGIDVHSTYSPVAGQTTLRLIYHLAYKNNWYCTQTDVVTAFLHSDLDIPMMLIPPPLIEIEDDECIILEKALYG